MNFLKQSAIGLVAWQLSSVVTLFQMSVAKVTAPESYNWIMDSASTVTVPLWELVCEYAGVVWSFLNTQ